MICRNCDEYEKILSIQKNLVETSLNITSYFKEHAILNRDRAIKCASCGSTIYKNEYYLEEESIDSIKGNIAEQIAEEVKKLIKACQLCPYGQDLMEMKYAIYRTFNEKGDDSDAIFESFNSDTLLGDLIENISDWDADVNENVYQYISCPVCHSGEEGYDEYNYQDWDADTIIYTGEDIDTFNKNFYDDEAIYKSITKEIRNIADVCDYEEMVTLKERYINNPFLYENNSIKRIIELVKILYDNNEMYTLDEFHVLYRTRVNYSDDIYSKDEMWEPPISLTRQSRYNTAGFPILYLSNSIEATKKEVAKQKDSKLVNEYYNIGAFKIKKELKCFKINSIFTGRFEGFINEEVSSDLENVEFKVQYIITNIMSFIIKLVGFDGVAYVSTKDPRYINFAIFEYKKNEDIEIFEVIKEKIKKY